MVIDKLLEYFQDLKRYYDDKKWGKFYDNYRNDPAEYEMYDIYFHNSYDDYEEAARDLCSEIREYMDLVWNEIPEDQVKLFDDGEKHNVREWLDETSRMFWNKLDNLTERETYGFLLQGYKMLKWIENAGRKTPDEFYGKYTGGQMPYYLGESKLKETSTILLTSHHHTDLPNNAPMRDGCSKCGDRSPDKVLQALKYWCDDFNIEDISGPEDNERICVDCFKKICKDRGVRLGKKHWWMREALDKELGKAFWYTCDGEYIEIPTGHWHIETIWSQPEKLGVTDDDLEKFQICYGSLRRFVKDFINGRIGEGSEAWNELMQIAFKRGNLRVREYNGKWNIDTYDTGKVADMCRDCADVLGDKPVYVYEVGMGGIPEKFTNAKEAINKLKEGLGKGFGQGLFDKDSVLTSKSKDDIEFEKFSKRFHDLMNDDEGWSKPPVCSECGWNPTYSDDIKTVDEWLEERNIPYCEAFEPVDRMLCDDCFDELVEKCNIQESDKTYKAKASGKWLSGNKLVKDEKDADTFESKTEPTQRLNQMKKDGKLNKNAKITVIDEALKNLFDEMLNEAITDFDKSNRGMYRYAKRKHDETKAIRKVSKEPYWVHPEGVAKIIMEHGGSDIEIKAGMAHDLLEDTGCTYDDLVEKFGENVASIVKEVTNDKAEIEKVGKEKYISEELVRLSPEALTVKLSDMLYNMKDSPTESNYKRMRNNVAFLMMNRELSGIHCRLVDEILEV